MKNVSFKLTKFQLEEVCHKLSIVVDEPDLCADYSFTKSEANDLEAIFLNAKPGQFIVTAKQAVVIAGELDNAADICRDNSYSSAVRSFSMVVDAINKQL